MFLHRTHLPQRLKVEHYTSPDIARRELETLFEPGWHCVGTVQEIPKSGDYLTLDLLERPLIVWHTEQGVRTFLNVCTHRFALLTSKSHGCAGKRLKCQYHGWEYDGEGNTCKIPDAQSFKPLKKGELGLREYRTEMVGEMIFVTLNADAPPVREFLGPKFVELIERWFVPQRRLTLSSTLDLDCNWKIAIENILESYHIACVHPTSFVDYPIAENCTHEFDTNFDHYIHNYTNEPRYADGAKRIGKLIGRPMELQWHHLLRYPNVILGGADPFHYLQMIWPTSSSTCRSKWVTLHDSGPRGKWWSFLLHRVLYRYGRYLSSKVQLEDAAIYPEVHRGTASRDRPHGGGLISTREERIFAFQDYWLNTMAEESASNGLSFAREAC